MNAVRLQEPVCPLAPMLTTIRGPNLSGRTTRLLELGRTIGRAGARGGAYVGLEAHNHISGLAATVREELALHADHGDENGLGELLADRLHDLLDRHPLTLSGGEQAMVALASAVAMRPTTLALDCATEQFSDELRTAVLNELRRWAARDHRALFVADNRLEEFGWLVPDHEVLCDSVNEHGESAERPFSADRAPLSSHSARPILLHGLRFAYPRYPPVLRDLSHLLSPGRVILLDGDNGSGKSTLAKLLAGIIRPLAGSIEYDGEFIHPWLAPAAVCGYHFQNPDVGLFTTSVADEVVVSSESRKTAHQWLDAVGLEDLASTHPLDLPFSLRKRVALAATLATPAPWLVIDEPTLGQDDATASQIATLLTDAAENGRGIIVISHSRYLRSRLSGHEHLKVVNGTLQSVETR